MAQTSLEQTDLSPRREALRLWIPLGIVLLLTVITAFFLTGQYQIAAGKGIVQGLGEPLPISSSAHLIVVPWFFDWHNPFFQTQTFDVALHMGTLIALLLFFWRDWLNLVLHAHQPRSQQGQMFWFIVLASIPAGIVGLLLDSLAEEYFIDKYLVIASTMSIMGVVLYIADRFAPRRYELTDLTWKHALLVGCAQALALIPGVSRSGSTMTMGRALGFTRETAARFSFLMAIPITFGAGVLKLRDIDSSQLTAPFWLGISVSFIVGALAVGFLLRYIRTNSFLPFIIYRLILAAVIVAVYVAR